MVKHKYRMPSVLIISFLLITACTQTEPAYSHSAEKLNSILWVQTSAEYHMAATQSYALARIMLDRGLEAPYFSWSAAVEQLGNYSRLPPALIVDVDETILNNSPFHARLKRAGTNWDINIWNRWVLESKAQAVPGAVEFLQYAQSKDVIVFYVTNRSHELEQATRENLIDIGCPMDDELDTLLTKGEKESWGSDKTNRRKFLAEQYRIILLIGDDANDFVSDTRDVSPELRIEALTEHQEYWGERWIVIPNPIYGGWDGALFFFNYDLSNAEIFELKFKHLDPLE